MGRSHTPSLLLPILALVVGIGGFVFWIADRDPVAVTVVENTSATTSPPANPPTSSAPTMTALSDAMPTAPEATTDGSGSAQTVAVEIVELREELVGLSGSAAVELLTPMASESVIDGVVADLETLRSSAPAGLRLRVGVLAINSRLAATDSAVVDLWVVQVATSSGVVRSSWSTVTVELHLDNNRWMVTQVSSRSGPTPGLVGEATDTAEFEQRLNGFTDDGLAAGT